MLGPLFCPFYHWPWNSFEKHSFYCIHCLIEWPLRLFIIYHFIKFYCEYTVLLEHMLWSIDTQIIRYSEAFGPFLFIDRLTVLKSWTFLIIFIKEQLSAQMLHGFLMIKWMVFKHFILSEIFTNSAVIDPKVLILQYHCGYPVFINNTLVHNFGFLHLLICLDGFWLWLFVLQLIMLSERSYWI